MGDTRPVRRRGRRVAVPAQPSLFDEPFDAPTDPATIDPGGTALPATSRAQNRATGAAAPAPIPERITPPAEPAAAQAAEAARQVVATDYRPGTTIHVPSGAKARARANLAAITLVRRLEGGDRTATREEQETLAGWSGWGAVPQIFDGRQEWTTENAQLRGLLSQQEYRRAETNTLNAHYTDPAIAGTVWEALRDAGFAGGRVLEPGCGAAGVARVIDTNITTELIGALHPPAACPVAVTVHPRTALVAVSGGRPSSWSGVRATVV